tara:strand:+ start:351 stop:794 length:444 start_codon:yes stop_codon:yes gene_type:complete
MNNRRKTELIIIHTSATPITMNIGAYEISKWHRAQGWLDIGYHFVIKRGGLIELGRPMEAVGAHAKGYNDKSVAICMIGGIDKDKKPENNYTVEQWDSLRTSLLFLNNIYSEAKVIGHNEVSKKDCPCFDVQAWLKMERASVDMIGG